MKPDHLADIGIVAVTHAHPDHLDEHFAKAIHEASPGAVWYGPAGAADQLASWGIRGLTSSNDATVRFVTSQHADLSPWFGVQPEHTSFVLFSELLVGGDCHTLAESHGARLLAGAINGGPWGGVVGFSKMIESMETRPEIVIPLHDWHLHDEARRGIYARLPEVLSQFGVAFIPLENGITTQV